LLDLANSIRQWLAEGTLTSMALITPSSHELCHLATALAIATRGEIETGRSHIVWPGGCVCYGIASMFPNLLNGLLVDTAVVYDPYLWSNQQEITDLLIDSLQLAPQRLVVWRPTATPELLLLDQDTGKTDDIPDFDNHLIQTDVVDIMRESREWDGSNSMQKEKSK
jgi:phage terminase large subunit-like protein